MIKSILLKKLDENASKWVVLAIDTTMVAVNFLIAYVIRFGITASFVDLNAFHQLPIVIVFALISFLYVGSYKGVIRQTGLKDAYNLFVSVSLFLAMSSILVFISRTYNNFVPDFLNMPLSIIDMHYLLNIITLITSRLAFKYCYNYIKYNQGKITSGILIYGAENYGINTLTTLINDESKSIKVVGFIDHEGRKKGKTINGVKVYSKDTVDKSFVKKHNVEEVIFSVPSLDKKSLSKISENADIREAQRMTVIFEKYLPNMVFHAAAYKHVPLMESYPGEAVKINILGTRNIAQLSDRFSIEKFVFVSTDKAVNPTNVMGATKRVAEMLIQSLQKTSKTKFITTRFGNVLGSNGSVMTIPEASQLVIEAGTMGKGGEIFIFDMGESVKIIDLAKKMIHLSGFKYPEDIDIKITGLRSGEKLYEELLASTDNTMPTYHKKIMINKCDEKLSFDVIRDKIEDLCIMDLMNQDSILIVKKLKEIVPEYISKNSVFEKIDNEDKTVA